MYKGLSLFLVICLLHNNVTEKIINYIFPTYRYNLRLNYEWVIFINTIRRLTAVGVSTCEMNTKHRQAMFVLGYKLKEDKVLRKKFCFIQSNPTKIRSPHRLPIFYRLFTSCSMRNLKTHLQWSCQGSTWIHTVSIGCIPKPICLSCLQEFVEESLIGQFVIQVDVTDKYVKKNIDWKTLFCF